MLTAKEILQLHRGGIDRDEEGNDCYYWIDIEDAMKEYAKQALELAGERASITKSILYENAFGHPVDPYLIWNVNKSSILNIIKELK